MASWVGVTTNAGTRLMAEWTNGTTLNVDRAVAGSGVVSAVSLLAQTALADEKQTVSIVSGHPENQARKIKIQIHAHDEEYVLNQIGLYASLDGGEQVLLALFQNERGITIPCITESPDFLYTFYCYLKVSNQANFTVSVDSSSLVAYGTMQSFVEEEMGRHNADQTAHEDIRRAIREQAKKPLFTMTDIEPEAGPVFWFDTSGGRNPAESEEYIVLLELGGETDANVTATIDGEAYSVSNLSEPEATQTGDYQITVL